MFMLCIPRAPLVHHPPRPRQGLWALGAVAVALPVRRGPPRGPDFRIYAKDLAQAPFDQLNPIHSNSSK